MTTAPIGESLLPCPFCDYVSEVKASSLERWFSVHCQQCRVTTKQYQTMTEAVAIWNRRSAPAALDEVARLRGALERSAALIGRIYAGGPDCDCTMDGGSHTCGWPEVIRAHEKNTEALKDPS